MVDDEDYLDDNDEPALSELIANTELGAFLSEPPKVSGEDDSFWMYDNDTPENDEFYDPTECPVSHRSGGVNIQIKLHSNQKLAERIDEVLDDGNLECGRFREHQSNSGEFLYLLSQSEDRV